MSASDRNSNSLDDTSKPLKDLTPVTRLYLKDDLYLNQHNLREEVLRELGYFMADH